MHHAYFSCFTPIPNAINDMWQKHPKVKGHYPRQQKGAPQPLNAGLERLSATTYCHTCLI